MTTRPGDDRPADATGHEVLFKGQVLEDGGDQLKVLISHPPSRFRATLWLTIKSVVFWGRRGT